MGSIREMSPLRARPLVSSGCSSDLMTPGAPRGTCTCTDPAFECQQVLSGLKIGVRLPRLSASESAHACWSGTLDVLGQPLP